MKGKKSGVLNKANKNAPWTSFWFNPISLHVASAIPKASGILSPSEQQQNKQVTFMPLAYLHKKEIIKNDPSYSARNTAQKSEERSDIKSEYKKKKCQN